MRVKNSIMLAMLVCAVSAQEPSKPTSPNTNQPTVSCGGGHTVDEYLAEKDKRRRQRNKNPLPSDVCIWNWCRTNPNGPPSDKLPTSHPPQETPTAQAPAEAGESSSKPKQTVVCDPYSAAQDVEVGDFYYQDKNYRAALNRYEGALQSKPGDPGIFLRLGKTAEKLQDLDRAMREYQSSINADAEGPAGTEAKAALERIKSKNAK